MVAEETDMKQMGTKGEWLNAIAVKAGVDSSRVQEVIELRRIHPSPVLPSPRRLLLKKISFSGTKDQVADAGPFNFVWDKLDCGFWAMMTESNLRGKSSVIEVVRWLLRGRPSSNLQEDVKRWITSASLEFRLDETLYKITVHVGPEITGELSRLEADAVQKMAEFTGELEFEAVMADFFMQELSLETVANWHSSSGEDGGKAVLHGWPALSGVMFVGTDYSSLLGDIGAATGVPLRLMQMYLGLPWVSTLSAGRVAQLAVKSDQVAKEKRRALALSGRKSRVETISVQLEAKRVELAQTPSNSDVRDALSLANKRFSELKSSERDLTERFDREVKAVKLAEASYADDRHELQAHLDAEAAGAVFRLLEPTCCPRCDAEIGDERRLRERKTHSCSVCGEGVASDSDSELRRDILTSRVEESKAALEKTKRAEKHVSDSLIGLAIEAHRLDSEIHQLSQRLASSGDRNRIEFEIAALEARLSEAGYDPEPEEPKSEEFSILEALISETESRVKSVQTGVLDAVSQKLVIYAKRFGMDALSAAQLKGNMALSLIKGGQDTSYSKVTDGEKLRLKVAAVLAMISVAEAQGVGRHPGLLMIDSPGAQEIAAKDLEELISGLEEVSKEFKHLQVFVAAMASPAIKKHVPAERTLYAPGQAALW